MTHSQGLSSNPYPQPNQPNFPHWYLSIQGPLSSHLRLGLPKDLFSVGLPVKILKELLPSSILATCPAHLNLVDLITLTILGERYKLWSTSLWSFLHSPLPSLLGPNIRLRILFSNTLSLHSCLNVRDYVTQPYNTTRRKKKSIRNIIFSLKRYEPIPWPTVQLCMSACDTVCKNRLITRLCV